MSVVPEDAHADAASATTIERGISLRKAHNGRSGSEIMVVITKATETKDEYPKTDIPRLALRNGDSDGVGGAICHAGLTHDGNRPSR